MAAICVFCASSTAIDPVYLELAGAVGDRIGRDGHSLVSGGGRVSMMGAVATAARAGGAHTTGVIPRQLVLAEVADTAADDLVVVENMRDRKAKMDAAADAFLVLPGGIGTLEEFFEIWTSASLGMHRKPVVLLDPFGFYSKLWEWLESMTAAGFVRPTALDSLTRVADLDSAFSAFARLTPAPR